MSEEDVKNKKEPIKDYSISFPKNQFILNLGTPTTKNSIFS